MHMSLSPVPELSKNSAFILIFLAHEKKKITYLIFNILVFFLLLLIVDHN
jgi:hypothetical protein